MKKYYRFADTALAVELPEEMPVPANMRLFEVAPESAAEHPALSCRYRVSVAEDAQAMKAAAEARWDGAVRHDRKNMVVYEKDGLECRLLSFEGDSLPYAVSGETAPDETAVTVARQYLDMYCYDTIFASLFSLEKRMLRQDALILHCAYMCRNGEAVLFSAPSGTGKSTQADLWEKYRGTRTINGDDGLLTRRDGTWYANGWPVCGSSEICFNESYPIRAIVMLFQAKENTIRRLNPAEAFRKIYPQLKVNGWNMAFQNRVFDLTDSLIAEVPVWELGCDISEEAVACLEKVL